MEPLNPENGTRDDLRDLLREGTKSLIAEAVDAELSATLAQFADYKGEACHRHVVRNGYLPEQEGLTGIGPVSVRARLRSEIATTHGSSSPRPFCRRILGDLRPTRSVEEVLPWLCLKEISTGDMQEGLEALLEPEAKGLSPAFTEFTLAAPPR